MRYGYMDEGGRATARDGPIQRRSLDLDGEEMTASVDFYGNKDPRDLPRYSYPEAARATGVPATTIKTWVYGYSSRGKLVNYLRGVIERPREGRLSFNNLIDVHVL